MKHLLSILAIFIVTLTFSQMIFWGPEIEVAPSTEGRNNPRVVLRATGEPVVMWGTNGEYVKVSVWDGVAFTSPAEPNGVIPALSGSNFGPDIAAHGDTLYVIFKESPPSNGKIFVSKSTDGGLNWGTPVQVDNIGSNLSEFVHIEVDDNGHPLALFNEFNAGWINARFSLARSNDYGATFGTDTLVTGWSGGGGYPACECCPAGISADGNTVIVTYRDNFNNLRDTWAAKSTDGGVSFTSGVDIDGLGWNIMSCPTTGPDCFIVGDTLYTVYMNAASGQGHVYYSKSEISTMTGGTATPITSQFTGLTKQNYPRLSIVGNEGVVFWQQTSGGRQQMAISYTNDITTGFPAVFDTIAENYSTIGDVVMDGNAIHVVWSDYSTNTVKYRKGTFTAASLDAHDEVIINAYPNPADTEWNLGFEADQQDRILHIFDAKGQLVIEKIIPSGTSKLMIPISHLEAGIYSCQIDYQMQSVQLIKQ